MFLKQIDHLSWAHPLVREWFINKFGAPTEPQEQGWPSILAAKATLISAPTGSGKTLAAFLTCIDELVRLSLSGALKDQTQVLYVSPLKALSNDIEKNLTGPLSEILELAKSRGLHMDEIRVAVRTGDTLMRDRQAMLKKPSHILVTTPESLYILLTAQKSRMMLTSIKTVIVDEIHALINDKRGAHLSLSLERLNAICLTPPTRIGLSATQKPIEVVANFLTGNDRPPPTIINIGHVRRLDLAVLVPSSELTAVASNEIWDEIYDKLAELAEIHRSTLVFVNTRRLAERIAHHLSERLGDNQVAAHHGSLSRKLRLTAESKLKEGQLKILVATASLELGIDIGMIDLVCQIGSPRAIAVALQRIGRAGHWHGAISKGRIFATTRDELLECAALAHAILEGDLDELIIPKQPLDILAQQLVATCATGDWREEDLFLLVKNAYPYAHLTKDDFQSILNMLSEGIAGSRGRYGAYLFQDKVNNMVKARRGSRLTAITSGGAIPENGLFTVVAEPQEIVVGTLDEDFAVESNRGDIILLGTTSWQIKRIESATGRVLVEDAHGAPPSVPFWRGEAAQRSKELSYYVSKLRQKLSDLLPLHNLPISETSNQPDILTALHWIKTHCKLDDAGAQQLLEYIRQGRAVLGAVPTQQTVIAERFFDEAGGMQLVIHAPFGARINKAWGLALRKRFCRSFNFELQAAATDDGLNIALAEQHSFPLSDVFHFLHPNTIKDVLVQAVLQSPLFTTRWRWDATRSLALVRFRNGKKVPPPIIRIWSDDLLAAVFPDAAACQDNLGGRDVELPEHPLINETMKDVLTEALDIDGLIAVLQSMYNGEINCIAVDTPLPSPFSHEILNANPYAFLDDAPLEERRARAVEMRRMLPESVLQAVGQLDLSVIHLVQEAIWPDIRNADELHDMLQTLIAFPLHHHLSTHQSAKPNWQVFFDELVASNRVVLAMDDERKYWVAVEKIKTFMSIYPSAHFYHTIKYVDEHSVEAALEHLIRGWMSHVGPISNIELSQLLDLEISEIDQTLIKLESTGFILRGKYRENCKEPLEWCERRILARIHRLTLGKLRKEIEPVTAAQFMRWLLKWQHVAPNSQLSSEQGLLEIIKQLQGFEIAANAWENQIFAKRIHDYQKSMLDQLCLSGVVGWGRLSPHPATQLALNSNDTMKSSKDLPNKKRVMPTSVAPITFFIREESDWMAKRDRDLNAENVSILSHVAKDIYTYLKEKGASFFSDILHGVKRLKAEVETGLWELVTAGLITADGFDNLRALIDPRRRLDKHRRQFQYRYSAGRWSLIHSNRNVEQTTHLESICWMLLKRYGVVFRELLAREKNIPRWRELLITFRQLEDRGHVRGGRFVSGFIGEQFALPSAIDSLRIIKKQEIDAETTTISTVDPLNLVGIILPGTRIPANSSQTITLKNGECVNSNNK